MNEPQLTVGCLCRGNDLAAFTRVRVTAIESDHVVYQSTSMDHSPTVEKPFYRTAKQRFLDRYSPEIEPCAGDVWSNDAAGERTLVEHVTDKMLWTTDDPRVCLMDSGFTNGLHRLVRRPDTARELLLTLRGGRMKQALHEAHASIVSMMNHEDDSYLRCVRALDRIRCAL